MCGDSEQESLVVVRLGGANGVTAADLRAEGALSESRWANAAAATAARPSKAAFRRWIRASGAESGMQKEKRAIP
ncbi:MAG: hypothetical protein ABJC13_20955 [Acidobacteriota bacterium]